MMQKLFCYQYNKGRTKSCHILKAHKFFLMIHNYMDISLILILNFFRFLCVFLNQICADLYTFLSWFWIVVNWADVSHRQKIFFISSKKFSILFYLTGFCDTDERTEFPVNLCYILMFLFLSLIWLECLQWELEEADKHQFLPCLCLHLPLLLLQFFLHQIIQNFGYFYPIL